MWAEAMTSLPDLVRVLHCRVERHPTTERVADNVRLVETQVVDECADVISHQAYVDRSINISGSAMALQVDGDDLVALGECRKDRTEHLSGAEPAMQQDQRAPGSDLFDSRD